MGIVEKAWSVWRGERPPAVEPATIEEFRSAYDGLFGRFPVADDVVVSETTAGGLRLLRVGIRGVDPACRILYLHGGGYMSGQPEGVRDIAGRLAREGGAEALIPDYRLAPEHPHPAAVDDAVAAYRWLRQTQSLPVVLAGDSAGGGLVVAALVALCRSGDPLPAAAVCFSPWADLHADGRRPVAGDAVVNPATLRLGAQAYLGAADRRDPTASPVFADLSGLPPLLVQAGGAELLASDASRLAQRARAAGVQVTLDIVDGMPHVFQYFAAVAPEADAALRRAGRFIVEHTV
jgi:acetyl esterase/lipase